MDFGLGVLGYNGCWDDVAFAEQHGFATAGFVDSPLLSGDPLVAMALTAQKTSSIRLGTFLAIPGNRNAATLAAGVAAVNRLAPGRTFLGVGTGYTGRQTFGMGPVAASKLRDYALDCRDLLDGKELTLRSSGSKHPIQFDHLPGRFVDVDSHVPVYMAADGPKALAAAGEGADGLVVTLQYSNVMDNAPAVFAQSLAAVRQSAADSGRDFDDAYTVWSIVTCVLEPGESAASPRALEHVGAGAMMAFHSYACNPAVGEHLPPAIRERLDLYEKEVLSRLGPPRERAYMKAHSGHLSHLLDGEAAVLTDEIVRMTTLTGTAQEIAGQLRALEDAGLKNVTFWAPPQLTRETVLSIERDVMPLLEGTRA
jgi:alkanesulfonate monooxygenase SsuD/methylene tetrahydromethanopterin reductase-like flavin-dependent oxidoreductase (luciferase family)